MYLLYCLLYGCKVVTSIVIVIHTNLCRPRSFYCYTCTVNGQFKMKLHHHGTAKWNNITVTMQSETTSLWQCNVKLHHCGSAMDTASLWQCNGNCITVAMRSETTSWWQCKMKLHPRENSKWNYITMRMQNETTSRWQCKVNLHHQYVL